jgi:hypothetical protein
MARPKRMGELVQLRPLARASTDNAKLRDWLNTTAEAIGSSFEQWCQAADVSPSTVTRFLNHGYPVPKLATVERLAQAARAPMPWDQPMSPAAFVPIPLLDGKTIAEFGRTIAIRASEQEVMVPRRYAHCIAVVQGFGGVGCYTYQGDVLVCDPDVAISEDGPMIVAVMDGKPGPVALADGWLVPFFMTEGVVPVPVERATIVGVLAHLQRNIR